MGGVLHVPILDEGVVVGFLGFSSIHDHRQWSEDEILLLKMAGQVITSGLQRKKVHEALKDSEEKYRSLFHNMMNAFAFHKVVTNEKGKPINNLL